MRRDYLDNIRWMTVCLVVVYHVIYMFNGVAPAGVAGPFSKVQYQDAVQYVLYPWFMVLLFLVSGMCARYYLEKHSTREFVRARSRKLLVPSTLGLFVFQWIQGYINGCLSNAWESMPEVLPGVVRYLIMALSGIGVLWFIQMLWIFSMLLVVIRKIEKGRIRTLAEKFPGNPIWLAVLGVFIWAAAQVLNTPVIVVYHFGIYGLAFLFGYYIFSQERITDVLAKHSIILGVIAAVLAVVQVGVYFGQNYAVEPVVNSPLTIAYCWMMCLSILGLMKRCGNGKTAFTEWMTRKSWGLYLFHYLPVSACGMTLGKTDLPVPVIYLLTTVAAFLGAFVLNEVISRIPILRWCVLGIKKNKRENTFSA